MTDPEQLRETLAEAEAMLGQELFVPWCPRCARPWAKETHYAEIHYADGEEPNLTDPVKTVACGSGHTFFFSGESRPLFSSIAVRLGGEATPEPTNPKE